MRLGFIKKKFSIHGGAERYLQTLLRQLRNGGHEIHIFANSWTEEAGLVFHKVNTLHFGSFLSTITFNHNAKKAVAESSGLDCIISLERTVCQDIYRAGEGCHAEWLDIRSQTEPFYKRLSFKINPLHLSLLSLEKKLFSATRFIVANSNMVKGQIIKHYAIPETKITVIYNGVDLTRFNPENRTGWREDARKELAISQDTKVLLFVGSGFERKGLKSLIDAGSLIRNKDLKIIIAGRGDVNKYRSLSEKYGIAGKIIFTGTHREIEKIYAAADLFVLPTLYDPFSNATLEAMAAGLPAITTRNNGVAELIEDGQEGFVLKNLFDAEELAVRILFCLDNIHSMGKKARQKAEQFPIERAAGEFTRVIERVRNDF